jgi:branched-chain amino acid transport system permease protein
MRRITAARLVTTLFAAGLLLLPLIAILADKPFWLDAGARLLIFALAALSLDLILGYGGMVSFGHALYLGVGAYTVGILGFYGIDSGWVHVPAALAFAALIALVIGALSLRTGGFFFIMITLAFTQMAYFLGVSLKQFGGDDGMGLKRRSQFGVIDLADPLTFYLAALGCLGLCLFLCRRIVSSRFGRVIRGSMLNDRRMQAIGFPTFRYRLVAFVISGAMCGLAGVLLANQTEFVTPEYMNWIRSGEIMIMVILGGVGTLIGPVFGAFAYLMLENALAEATQHWQFIFGPALILIVLFARSGLYGLLQARSAAVS